MLFNYIKFSPSYKFFHGQWLCGGGLSLFHSFAIFLLLLHLPPDHPAVDADGHPAVDADGHPVVDADGHPPCIMVGMLDKLT